jgi:hypothetical protein
MKILRSVNRRGSSVQSAGFFTVLRANTWFAASRLPGVSSYLVDQSKWAASLQAHDNPTGNPTAAPLTVSISAPEQKAQGHADSRENAIPLQIMMPSTYDHRPIRLALIVLAAAAITLIMLWWIANP